MSAAHCFNDKYKDSDWFVRVGDNYIAEDDPSEQTFQVSNKEFIYRTDLCPSVLGNCAQIQGAVLSYCSFVDETS